MLCRIFYGVLSEERGAWRKRSTDNRNRNRNKMELFLPEINQSPVKNNASPVENNASPAKKNASPALRNRTLLGGNQSPVKKNASPALRNRTFLRGFEASADNPLLLTSQFFPKLLKCLSIQLQLPIKDKLGLLLIII